MTDHYKPRASTHADGWEIKAEVEQFRADLMESDEFREKLVYLLKRIAAALKGEPPDGVWHSWHDLPEKAAQLTESLWKLEERAQRDEALLRQALEALEFEAGGWEYPPPKTTAAITALRERLGEGAKP